ncbi:MAG: glycosyltransferase family 9 protein, partial [Candidatus Omnitrophica bacterium]|nr:glycosyltransferase family 9 protein [Candidatus Omnitrophota bacterium]
MYVYKKKIYRLVFYMIDMVGTILFFPVKAFASKRKLKINKILVIRVDHIGDVITATSVIEPLRKKYPKAILDFMVPSNVNDILKNDPYLDNVLIFDPPWFNRKKNGVMSWLRGIKKMVSVIKKGRYDAVIDLRGDFRHIAAMTVAGVKDRISYGITGGGFLLSRRVSYKKEGHEIDKNIELLRPLGIECPFPKVKLVFSAQDKEKIDQLRDKLNFGDKYAVLHVIPGHSSKIWNKEKFGKVAEYIFSKKNLKPVFIGSESDSDHIKEILERTESSEIIDVSGKTSLGMLGYLLNDAFLFVG